MSYFHHDMKELKRDLKRFYIVLLIAVVLIALACIFLWDDDRLLYIIWGIFAAVGVYKGYLTRKIDGRL